MWPGCLFHVSLVRASLSKVNVGFDQCAMTLNTKCNYMNRANGYESPKEEKWKKDRKNLTRRLHSGEKKKEIWKFQPDERKLSQTITTLIICDTIYVNSSWLMIVTHTISMWNILKQELISHLHHFGKIMMMWLTSR